MSSKKRTTSTSTAVETPSNPAFVTSGLNTLTDKVSSLAGQDPTSFIAGPDPLLTQAGTAAGGLTNSPDFAKASGMLTAGGEAGPNLSGGPASLLDNLQAYMSPYTKDVVDASLADYNVGAGQTRAQNQLSLAGDTTFGGSGGAIQTAMSNDAIDRGRGTLAAGLRDQAFNTGANLSNLDATRRQQSAMFDAGQRDTALQRLLAGGSALTTNGSASGADARGNIGSMGDMGQILQQLEQLKAGAPLTTLGALSGTMGTLPLGLLRGGTTDTTTNSVTTGSNPLGAIGSLAMGVGALGLAPFTGGLSLGSLAGLGGLKAAAASGALLGAAN